MIEIDPSIPNAGWFDYQNFYDKVVQEMPNGGTFVEIGTYHGRSAIYLALKMLESSKRFRIITLENNWLNINSDNPEVVPTSKDKIISNFIKCGVERFVDLIMNDSLKINHLTDVDWVFLDCTIDYEPQVKHIKHWLPKIKKGGIISGHDYELFEGVNRAVNHVFHEVSNMGACWYVRV